MRGRKNEGFEDGVVAGALSLALFSSSTLEIGERVE